LIVGGGVVAVLGLAFTALRTYAANFQAQAANDQARAANEQARVANEQARVANEQVRLAEQGHITDRFTKAIEQLGSDKLEVRLGAIYALARVARDSQRDHGPIMETLTAYVREKTPWLEGEGQTEEVMEILTAYVREKTPLHEGEGQTEKVKPATDIQALLTVIGRRHREYDLEGQRLDLRGTDLRGADLREAHLEGANLSEAHLERANLRGAHFEEAYLHEAQGLTQAQLDQAFGDEKTKLPEGLTVRAWDQAKRVNKALTSSGGQEAVTPGK
jgi:type II secretory pathway pseudopilin PulG